MSSPAGKGRAASIVAEPVVHFFALGVLLFAAHRAFVGDPRTVVVTPAIKAELGRLFQEANGRPPSAGELAAEVSRWKRDEALFREAEREHLERDDPGIRTILVDKMRMRAALGVPKREPTEAELDAWLAAHRGTYETPASYDFEFVAFPKADARARADLDDFARALRDGKDPTKLGRSVIGGNLTAADLKERVEPELAAGIPSLAPGGWQPLETPKSFVLARVKSVNGGVPTREKLGARLVADWKRATQEEAIDRALAPAIARYRFEEPQ